MNQFIQLIVRHGLMLLSGALAAHHFDNLNTTAGIVLAILVMIITTCWSYVAKMLHLENLVGETGLDESDCLRTLLGALISHGITFASAYFSIDANDPNLLAVAAINALASHYGMHQQIAHGTPLDVATRIKPMLLLLCMALVSCATTTAILSSPFGRAVIASADQLAAQVVKTTEETGLSQIILQASAKVAALNAEGVNADIVKETLRLSEIAGFKAVINAAQDKYQALTGQRFTLPKNPVKVTAAKSPREDPASNFPPPCDEPDAEAVPACMRIANRIPLYGYKVAFMLSTAEIKN